ncbi:hypothetical protein Enr10x_56770 [Gimesia panareensis]|uniref:Uncharacterized protein n=1 Tax=Gimesia panareensis TaxID=2527978 RepID=A0A518AFA7_9PLAN|nr:hypothetical protein Enr10x_56770 [Gimesia panareensis]QDU53386.1 hypothetical protein Pan110_57760 [Gimesia panareensis]
MPFLRARIRLCILAKIYCYILSYINLQKVASNIDTLFCLKSDQGDGFLLPLNPEIPGSVLPLFRRRIRLFQRKTLHFT